MFPVRLCLAVVASSVLALGVAACGDDDKGGGGGGGGGDLSGTIKIDGSSTVAPLSEAAAEQFQSENPGVRVTVGTSGTGGGFEKFCAGETDISDASRQIEPDETSVCKKAGIAYDEVQVANDGIALIVNPNNDFATCLTTEQLKTIWDKGSSVDNWSKVDPKFDDLKLELFGAGTDSGTFDFFTEAINGEEGRSRSDYSATEDDNVTVEGVSGSEGGLGYLGLSYVEQNPDKVKAVQTDDSGKGCVEPTTETVQTGKYTPLSRPLFIYPATKALQRPEVKAFVEFYNANLDSIVEQALFVPLTDEQKTETDAKVKKIAG